MINTLIYKNLTMGTLESGYLIEDIKGFGSPAIKMDIKERGSTNGADLGVKYYGRRVMIIDLLILGQNPTDYENKRRALQNVLDIQHGLQPLTINTRGGLTVTANVITSSDFDMPYKKGDIIMSNARLEFTSPYPFFQGATNKDILITPWQGGGFAIDWSIDLSMANGSSPVQSAVNSGNAEAYPIITLYGQLEDATITNETNDKSFSLDYNLADGSTIKIDTYNRTVVLNNSTNIRQYFSGDWLYLNPSTNGIKLTSTSYGANAKVFVSYKDTYLGI